MIFAASFDCGKAKSQVEKIICGNEELSKLDDSLNDAYLKALNRPDSKKQTMESQKQWIKKERDICRDVACMKQAYEVRIKELGLTSSFGIVFFREKTPPKPGEEKIKFGTAVRADEQSSRDTVRLSSENPPRELAANAEIVVISGYEPSNQKKVGTVVRVDVNRPGSKVLLILTGYAKISWEVSASSATTITGIMVSGYTTPNLKTSIRTKSYLVKLPYACQTDNANFADLLDKLNAMFGIRKIDVFRGSYSIPSLVKISSLDAPSPDLTREGYTPQKQERNFTFEIIGRDFKKEVWSLTGPVKADKAADKNFKTPAKLNQRENYDPMNMMTEKIAVTKRIDEIYRLHNGNLEIINRVKDKSEIANLPPNFPTFSWAMDVAYDSRRDIVTVVTLGGEGVLYRFDAKRKKWIDFRSLNNIDLCSLSYDESKDRYVAWNTMGDGDLYFISAEGEALFKRNIISKLAGFGRLYDRGNGPPPCLKIAPHGDDIALIHMRGNTVTNIWCYDVKSDMAILTYKNP